MLPDTDANLPESTDPLMGSAAPAGTGAPTEPSQAATSGEMTWKDVLAALPPDAQAQAQRAVELRAGEVQSGLTPKLQEAAEIRRQNQELRERLEFLERNAASYGEATDAGAEKIEYKEPATYAEYIEQQRQLIKETMDERLRAVDDYVESQRKRDVGTQMDALTGDFPQLKDSYERERLSRFAYRLLENKELTPKQAAQLLYHDDLVRAAREQGRQEGLRGIQGAQTAAGATERPSGGSPGVPAIKPLSAEEWQKDKYAAFERIARDIGKL